MRVSSVNLRISSPSSQHMSTCHPMPGQQGWRGREDPITAFYSDVILPFAIQSSTYLIHCPALSSLYE